MKITIEIQDVKESPNSQNKVICSFSHFGKIDKNSHAYAIALNAI